MDKVRVAIVGCGTISQLNVPGYLEHDRCEIVVLCDPVRERAESKAADWGIAPRIYERFEGVLDDPEVDAVELLTPTALHADQSIAALQAGKHVSCQKPIANTVSDADRVASAVSNANSIFRVTENFLYYPPLVKAKELMEDGAIGEPSLVRIRTLRGSLEHARVRYESDALKWRRDAESNAGGLLFDDGWHKFATAMWWLGEVESVFGFVTRTDDFITEAPSVITWRFKDRDCLGVFDFSYAPEMSIRTRYYPSDEFFEVQGSKGSIWVTRCTGEVLDMAPVILVRGDERVEYQVPMDWIDGFKGASRDFVDAILEGRQPHMDVDFAKRVLQTVLAAYEASDANSAVSPDNVA